MKKLKILLFALGLLLTNSYNSLAEEGTPPDKPRPPSGPIPSPPKPNQ